MFTGTSWTITHSSRRDWDGWGFSCEIFQFIKWDRIFLDIFPYKPDKHIVQGEGDVRSRWDRELSDVRCFLHQMRAATGSSSHAELGQNTDRRCSTDEA